MYRVLFSVILEKSILSKLSSRTANETGMREGCADKERERLRRQLGIEDKKRLGSEDRSILACLVDESNS